MIAALEKLLWRPAAGFRETSNGMSTNCFGRSDSRKWILVRVELAAGLPRAESRSSQL